MRLPAGGDRSAYEEILVLRAWSCGQLSFFDKFLSFILQEEVLDESQNLEELQPFLGLFQVVKKKGDTTSKTLDKNINFLIGRGKFSFSQVVLI